MVLDAGGRAFRCATARQPFKASVGQGVLARRYRHESAGPTLHPGRGSFVRTSGFAQRPALPMGLRYLRQALARWCAGRALLTGDFGIFCTTVAHRVRSGGRHAVGPTAKVDGASG